MFKWQPILIILIALSLVACSPTDNALPTRVVLPDDTLTEEAPIIVADAPTEISIPTETPVQSGARPLPPTFTPIPTEPPAPTRTPAPQTVTSTSDGAILFVYNEDSIIRINADGTGQELIITFGVGVRLSEMRLSPRGDLIAFIAPGSGSAREVWIANTTGTYLQQVSCLGFADVRHITWSADGQVLGLVGAQSVGSPQNIYTVGWQGANECPFGNNQRMVAERNSTQLAGLAFSIDGGRLFFSDPVIYAVNLADFTLSEPLTQSLDFGADFGLVHSPTANTLVYIRDMGDIIRGRRGGNMVGLNVATLDDIRSVFDVGGRVEKAVWSRDGQTILQSTATGVYTYPILGGIGTTIDSDTAFFPNAVFSPDSRRVAYLDADSTNRDIPQIYIASVADGTSPRQLTFITEGTIGDIIWVSQ